MNIHAGTIDNAERRRLNGTRKAAFLIDAARAVVLALIVLAPVVIASPAPSPRTVQQDPVEPVRALQKSLTKLEPGAGVEPATY